MPPAGYGPPPPFLRQNWRNAMRYGLQSSLALYLLLFFLLPVGFLFLKGIQNSDGTIGTEFIAIFLANPVYWESVQNSLLAGAGAACLAGLLALVVAAMLWQGDMRLSPLLELCGFLPLFMPTFVLASSLEALIGGNDGLVGLLQGTLGMSRAGASLLALTLIEAIHYFPFILIALLLTTRTASQQANILRQLGIPRYRLIRQVFLPLARPGLAFALALTFLKVIDDLATPLTLGMTNMLAPQAYHRIAAYGAQDPLAALIAALLFLTSGLIWFVSLGFIRQNVSILRSPPDARPIRAGKRASLPHRLIIALLGVGYLGCYAGLMLSSLAGVWSHSLLPETYVLTHYLKALQFEMSSLYNTLIYCGLAALIDLLVALPLAHAIAQASSAWKQRLNWLVAGTLCIPGVSLAIAYLALFRDTQLPLTDLPLDATGLLLTLAFSIRGLPFALHICTLALNGIPASHLEAARALGATPVKVVRRIVFPMLGFGLLLAFTLCFSLAAVDLSLAALLVPNESNAPLAYSIYLHLQSPSGMNVGAALAIISFALLALILFGIIHRLHLRNGEQRSLSSPLFSTHETTAYSHGTSHH